MQASDLAELATEMLQPQLAVHTLQLMAQRSKCIEMGQRTRLRHFQPQARGAGAAPQELSQLRAKTIQRQRAGRQVDGKPRQCWLGLQLIQPQCYSCQVQLRGQAQTLSHRQESPGGLPLTVLIKHQP